MARDNVSWTNTEYKQAFTRWRVMRATIGGEDVLKGDVGNYDPETFLPMFDDGDTDRYNTYKFRAVYDNFTGNTHSGLLGSVFRKKVEILLPDKLEYIRENIDGMGLSLDQFSREVVSENLGAGRLGLLADKTGEGDEATVARIYPAESILGYEIKIINKKKVLVSVRLLELKEVVSQTSFEVEYENQYRELALDEDGYYYQQVYNAEEKPVGDPVYPLDFNGNKWDLIPFQFIGAKNNDPNTDKPPLLDIAFVNLGHYRNSADHEENLYIAAQGTAVFSSDWTAKQFNEANPGGIKLGVRRGYYLGPNASANLLQLDESQALGKEMERKEQIMIALGARFIQDNRGDRTATESVIDESQQNSQLDTVVGNCADGIRNLLIWMDLFERPATNPDDIDYDLNRSYFDKTLTPQEITAMIMLKDGGIIGKSDVRSNVRGTGLIEGDRTDEEIDQEIADNGE